MAELIAKIGAVLFVAANGLSIDQLTDLTHQSVAEIEKALNTLQENLYPVGLQLTQNGSTYIITTRSDFARPVEAVLNTKPISLTTSALEVLAIIAYNQPIKKSQIDEIRGVGSDTTLRSLVGHDLITEHKTSKGTLAEVEFTTSADFLQSLGLKHISELPRLDD